MAIVGIRTWGGGNCTRRSDGSARHTQVRGCRLVPLLLRRRGPCPPPVPRRGANALGGGGAGAGRRVETWGRHQADGPEGRGEGRSASEIMARSFAAAGQNKSLLLHIRHTLAPRLRNYGAFARHRRCLHTYDKTKKGLSFGRGF